MYPLHGKSFPIMGDKLKSPLVFENFHIFYCFFVSIKDLKFVLVSMIIIVSRQGFWRGFTWKSTSCL